MAEGKAKDKTVSPRKRTKSDQQVIVIEDKEMENETKEKEAPKHHVATSKNPVQGQKEVVVTPTKEKKKSRDIDFLADDEDEYETAPKRLNKVIDKWEDKEKKREDHEREAVAF